MQSWAANTTARRERTSSRTERVSNEYLGLLRDRGVSYLIAGKEALDLPLALEKLGMRFRMRTLMLLGPTRLRIAGARVRGATRWRHVVAALPTEASHRVLIV